MASISASPNTTQHDLPPSSSDSFLMLSAAATMIFLPVAVDPVKLRTSTPCESASRSLAAYPRSLTRFTAPLGNAVSSKQRIIAAVTSEVWAAGLTIAVQPAASAGASERTSNTAGAFHGTMIATTPAASRSIVDIVPGSGSSTCPAIWRARPA